MPCRKGPVVIPTTMRAAVLEAPHQIEIRQVPTPEPGPRDVLIQVKRAGICGTDIHMYHGKFAPEAMPVVPGHEFSGVVAAVGSEVSDLRVGERVTADINVGCGHCFFCRKNEILLCREMYQLGIHRNGGFADYVVVPARLVILIPDEMSFALAALTEPLSCCVRSSTQSRLRAAESVLVIGAGPIGNLHVQLARVSGAAPIIVADLNTQRLQMAKDSGADVLVEDQEKLEATVMRYTGGRGADLVIESVGSPALYERAMALVRPGGRIAAFGVAAPEARATYMPFAVVLREIGMKGTVASSGDDYYNALTLLQYGRIKTDYLTSEVRPLEELKRSIEELVQQPSVLKIQISVSD
jgi:2-desacetyl-2-hydroxyethyl bacteriochlorophyllide A dehydrogenase